MQIGEVMYNGDAKPIMQLNIMKDTLEKVNDPTTIFETLNLYTGLSKGDIEKDINEKVDILKWMVKNNITDINKIGMIMSKHYRKKPFKHMV